MMNKSKIGYCDFTFNPVTGCLDNCKYCYARQQTRRLSGDIRLNKGSDQLRKDKTGLYVLDKPFKNLDGKVTPHPVGFEPLMHLYRLPMLAQKKKAANILVCSLADLFGPWVPDEWIEEVFKACDAAPWHNYIFMTRYPGRYKSLDSALMISNKKNYWYGTTVTNQEDIKRLELPGCNQFLNIEPIHGGICIKKLTQIKWIILGAETGNRRDKVRPKREWVNQVVQAARTDGIPIFMKQSKELEDAWGKSLIKEFPKELRLPEDKPIPHCRKCEHCTITQEGKRGNRHDCEIGWQGEGYDDRGARHVLGRYASTSPPWCPLRY